MHAWACKGTVYVECFGFVFLFPAWLGLAIRIVGNTLLFIEVCVLF